MPLSGEKLFQEKKYLLEELYCDHFNMGFQYGICIFMEMKEIFSDLVLGIYRELTSCLTGFTSHN